MKWRREEVDPDDDDDDLKFEMLPASTMFSINGTHDFSWTNDPHNNYTVIIILMMLRNKLLFYFLHLM